MSSLTPAPSALEAVFHDAAVGHLLLDAQARVLCANQAFARLVSLPPHSLPGREMESLVSTDQKARLSTLLDQLNQGELQQGRIDLCFEGDFFSEVWAEVALAARRAPDGSLLGLVGTAMDSTERRQREQRQAQRFGLTLQAAELGQWEWHVQGDDLEVDAYWSMTLGYTGLQALRSMAGLIELVHPEDRGTAESELNACLSGQAAEFRCELRMRHASGAWIWVVHQGLVVEREAGGGCKRVIGTTRDVTRSKTAELALRRSQQHQQLAMSSARLGQWEWDLSGDQVSFDLRCAELFGGDPALSPGPRSQWFDRVLPEDQALLREQLRAGLASETGAFTIEHRLLHPQRGTVWLRNSGQVIERDDLGLPRQIVGLYEDITERKRSEEALRTAMEKAEAASRAKSAFLANMSHEIRTPMNAMIGLTRLVLEADLPPRERDFLQKVHASSLSLLAILNDILDLSKIEAGRMTAEKLPFSLDAVLDHVMQLFGQQAANKGLGLRRSVGCMPRVAIGDPARLTQVLSNLVGNAIKFTAQGEVELRAELVPLGRDQAELRCAVRDTGVGLTEEQKGLLFRPFSQADDSVTRRFGGTGLGLAISRQLVHLMGGDIGVHSMPGEGSEFFFTLRLGLEPSSAVGVSGAAVPSQPLGLPAVETGETAVGVSLPAGAEGRRFDGVRVLLVDDVELNREVAAETLRRLGVWVEEACDGEQAVARIQAQPWDLVLMDLHMPVLDGISAMRRLAAYPGLQPPPVVALTASVMEEDRVRCLASGMVDFIAKPLEAHSLRRVLARWVPERPSARSGPAFAVAAPVAPAQPDGETQARMTALLPPLRVYLQAQELVPDELIDPIRQAARQGTLDARWQRLLDRIMDFEHAEALQALDALAGNA